MNPYDTGHELLDEIKKLQEIFNSIANKLENKEEPKKEEELSEEEKKKKYEHNIKLAGGLAMLVAGIAMYKGSKQ